jgi:hypothetical protein
MAREFLRENTPATRALFAKALHGIHPPRLKPWAIVVCPSGTPATTAFPRRVSRVAEERRPCLPLHAVVASLSPARPVVPALAATRAAVPSPSPSLPSAP